MSLEEGQRCFWLLDTRNCWQGEHINEAAPKAFPYLSLEEQTKAQAYHFIKDAKMSVGSALLKRLFIVKSLRRPWTEVQFGRQGDSKHGKPCYVSPDPSLPSAGFNVSHQAGLVALAGGRSSDAEFGVDIVCVNERNDMKSIDNNGFDQWVDMFEDVFSPGEMHDMKNTVDYIPLSDGCELRADEVAFLDRINRRHTVAKTKLHDGQELTVDSNLIIEAKLRRFYAFWCLKEAYTKMVGEALLAKWLKDVEFRKVRSARPVTTQQLLMNQPWGETVEGIEVWFNGKQLQDITLTLQAFEDRYMIATAIKQTSTGTPPAEYVLLDPEHNIYPCTD